MSMREYRGSISGNDGTYDPVFEEAGREWGGCVMYGELKLVRIGQGNRFIERE